MVTMAEVAAKAGVAKSTVSRVLNGDFRISEDTRKAVNQVIDELGYVKQSHMLSRTVGLLGLYLRSMFWLDMLRGIDDQCISKGYNLLLRHIAKGETDSLSAANKLCQNGIGGIIWRPTTNERRVLDYLKSVDLPFVLIDTAFDDADVSYVTSNNKAGARILTAELLKLEKGPVCCISPIKTSKPERTAMHRIEGYREAISNRQDRIECIVDAGYEVGIQKATAEYAAKGIRCFFCEHSMITALAIEALENDGSYDISDFYFADFDEHPIHLKEKLNSLTAIQQGYEMGRLAMKILWEKQKAKVSRRKQGFAERHIELDLSFVGHGEMSPPKV